LSASVGALRNQLTASPGFTLRISGAASTAALPMQSSVSIRAMGAGAMGVRNKKAHRGGFPSFVTA